MANQPFSVIVKLSLIATFWLFVTAADAQEASVLHDDASWQDPWVEPCACMSSSLGDCGGQCCGDEVVGGYDPCCKSSCSQRCGHCKRCRSQSLIGRLLDPERKRIFPLLNEQARAFGYQLPLPFGVGGNIAYIDQQMNIQGISLEVAGGPVVRLNEIPPFRIRSRDTNVSSRFDFWLLPFLNVYGIVGHTSGTAAGTVRVNGVPGLAPDTLIPVRIEYDGPTYGGGVTAAVGYENMFAVVDWNYAATDLEGVDRSIAARTVGPRVGFQGDRFAAWVGGFYMNIDKDLSSTVDVGGIPVRILVDLDAETAWNFIYGARWLPCDNLELVIEHGFSRRNQVIGAAALRF